MSNATKINLDTSSRVDVTCRKGDTFSLRLTVTAADGIAVGFAADDIFLFQVRDSDTGDLVTNGSNTFSASVTADVANAGGINDGAGVTNTSLKYIDLSVSAAIMKTMPSGLYVYDVEQKSAAVVSTLIFGTLKVNEDVSITA
tara:strand:+ start:785 stop:1213 length:429 start_codon:yes stop_codon:yes gene_type:complete